MNSVNFPKRNIAGPTSLAALSGGLGVALGAFGAHALKTRLHDTGMTEVWQTAVLYQLVHAVAALAASLAASTCADAPSVGLRRAAWCWLVGTLLFSGSLYALALGGPKVLGPVTPIGGVLFIAGWAWVAIASSRKSL